MATAEELIYQMPQRLNEEKAGDFDATIQFDLSGDGGGQWYVTVADGNAAVADGRAEAPTATIRMTADDFVSMTTGELNPMNAFMMGKVRVEGDLNAVMKFQTMFDM